MSKPMEKPDWPPIISAIGIPDGVKRYGSTGQLFEVRGGQWIRVMEKQPEIDEVWKNTRRGYHYRIVALPFWSDSKDENNLERWVVCRNLDTGVEYTRSIQSFLGINRDGNKRFELVSRQVPC